MWKRPLLISVSGIVGSGKTVTTSHIVTLLKEHGIKNKTWRFQSLPCFTFLRVHRGGAAARDPHAKSSAPQARRWSGYTRRRLTARVTLGYLARIVAFNLYRRWHAGDECHVCNRFFYDNLVHYDLGSAREQRYAGILRRCIPKPDVAILLVVSPATVASRRPQYSGAYIESVGSGYQRLRDQFPHLIEVRTDTGHPVSEQLDTVLRERFARA